jgi:hypothetical protein
MCNKVVVVRILDLRVVSLRCCSRKVRRMNSVVLVPLDCVISTPMFLTLLKPARARLKPVLSRDEFPLC